MGKVKNNANGINRGLRSTKAEIAQAYKDVDTIRNILKRAGISAYDDFMEYRNK